MQGWKVFQEALALSSERSISLPRLPKANAIIWAAGLPSTSVSGSSQMRV
jgi:hypothetical protein